MLVYNIFTHRNIVYWGIVTAFSTLIFVLEYADSDYVILPTLGLITFYFIIFMARRKAKLL